MSYAGELAAIATAVCWACAGVLFRERRAAHGIHAAQSLATRRRGGAAGYDARDRAWRAVAGVGDALAARDHGGERRRRLRDRRLVLFPRPGHSRGGTHGALAGAGTGVRGGVRALVDRRAARTAGGPRHGDDARWSGDRVARTPASHATPIRKALLRSASLRSPGRHRRRQRLRVVTHGAAHRHRPAFATLVRVVAALVAVWIVAIPRAGSAAPARRSATVSPCAR